MTSQESHVPRRKAGGGPSPSSRSSRNLRVTDFDKLLEIISPAAPREQAEKLASKKRLRIWDLANLQRHGSARS